MLTAKNLTREFVSGDSTVVAVDDVSLTLEEGVFAAVVGPSGSGKSTLLSLLGTLDKPTSGMIEIDGRDVTDMTDRELTPYRRSRIGLVFQSYNLIPNLNALQNVMLPMEFAGVPKPDCRVRAERLLGQVGLSPEKQKRRPGRLSGGEQQRVAIARALANKPCLVLADEPTGNLDKATGARITELLHGLARSENTTILAVTHDLELAAQADVTFQLCDGRLVDPDVYDVAVKLANASYDAWVEERGDERLTAFVDAVAAFVDAAPADRRLSPSKIRRRYAEAVGQQPFDALMDALETKYLFEEDCR
jgi:putative ABC transport system ATP-binding protein